MNHLTIFSIIFLLLGFASGNCSPKPRVFGGSDERWLYGVNTVEEVQLLFKNGIFYGNGLSPDCYVPSLYVEDNILQLSSENAIAGTVKGYAGITSLFSVFQGSYSAMMKAGDADNMCFTVSGASICHNKTLPNSLIINNGAQTWIKDINSDVSVDFHEYGIELAKSEVIWRVDGNIIHSIQQTNDLADPDSQIGLSTRGNGKAYARYIKIKEAVEDAVIYQTRVPDITGVSTSWSQSVGDCTIGDCKAEKEIFGVNFHPATSISTYTPTQTVVFETTSTSDTSSVISQTVTSATKADAVSSSLSPRTTTSAISATSSLGDPTHFVVSASILQNSISTTSAQTTLAAAETVVNKAVTSSTSNATTTSARTTLATAETVVNKVAPSSTTNSTNSFVIGVYSTAASSANNSVVIDNLTVNQADDAIPSENADATVSYISTTITTSQGTAITEGVAIIVTTAGNIKESYTTSLKAASAGTASSLVSTSSSAVPHLLEAVANDNGVSSDSSTHSSTTLAAIAVSSVSIQHSSENSVSSLNFSNSGSVSNVFEKWIICILPVIFVTFI